MQQYVDERLSFLAQTGDPKLRANVLGKVGAFLRILGNLYEAESLIHESLALGKQFNLGIKHQIIQEIRLAHVLQWKGDFENSTRIFKHVLVTCLNDPEGKKFLSFAWQHLGKNHFDQAEFEKALKCFEEALKIRSEGSDKALEQSTQQAMAETRKRLSE